eukprot:CAMPEP_0116874234 /NCGR_PEP_ID=MMETSP0463-20121206/5672_1 /TAXON_ID=181622 /ORGANISM="Strombidinopsis sp, Strain SopsisLIS2011" /LENGTH=94 /DNA_ID=CAMNT_0004517627 /DNA_START=345 /DNA_END=629 /DNA_ORIENTATION=+
MLHWWAIFELGINYAQSNTLYNVLFFVFEIIVLGLMLFSGSKANKKKRYHAYLMEKVSEKRAAYEEAEEKKKQEDELAEMQRKRQEEAANNAIN